MLTAEITINTAKVKAEQPDIIGRATVAGEKYTIALWAQVTKDGTNDYFSGSFAEEGVKNPERHKIKLYSFAKKEESDPDYHSSNFSIGDQHYYVYLWVGSQKNNFDMAMELTNVAKPQKLSEKATYFMEFLGTRPSLSKHTSAPAAPGDPDDVPF